MVILLAGAWLLTAALAYYNTKATFTEGCKLSWDRATKEFVIICSLVLGPVFLLISLEIRILAAIGRGLAVNKTRRCKDA